MKVNIIGWYGTETIGDRAILDGLFIVLDNLFGESTVLLGSLYPFFSERTLIEDKSIYAKSAPNLKIEIYNVKNEAERQNAICSSDVLLIGGGPLMDLRELRIIEKCFKSAKRNNIPCIICGCGIGPLNNSEYRKIVKRLILMADGVSFRDEISLKLAKELCGDTFTASVLGDPAVISILNYRKDNCAKINKGNYIAVNFRKPHKEYGDLKDCSISGYINFIKILASKFADVRLIPMHTFAIGGDDRLFFSEIINAEKIDGVNIQHDPLNLYEIYKLFAEAKACVGMRYHSVVIQTILNGNNIILNYTNPKNGKITGFLSQANAIDFYSNRIIMLQNEHIENASNLVNTLLSDTHYNYVESNIVEEYMHFIKVVIDSGECNEK